MRIKIENSFVTSNILKEEQQGKEMFFNHEAYFSGQIDLDKTVDKIQNRVSLLLQEAR